MTQVNLDPDAYQILEDTKAALRDRGIRAATLSDAVRKLKEEGKKCQ